MKKSQDIIIEEFERQQVVINNEIDSDYKKYGLANVLMKQNSEYRKVINELIVENLKLHKKLEVEGKNENI